MTGLIPAIYILFRRGVSITIASTGSRTRAKLWRELRETRREPGIQHGMAIHPYRTVRRSRGSGARGRAGHPGARPRRGPHQGACRRHRLHRYLHPARPLSGLQGAAAVHAGLRSRRRRREDRARRGRAARGPDGRRSLCRRRLCAVCDPSGALSRAGPRWRRSRRSGVHPSCLSHRLPDAHSLSPPVAREPRSWSSAHPARWARRCSIWRDISASRRSAPARPPTSPQSSASARQRSTIAQATSSRPCAASSAAGGAGVDTVFDAIGGAHFAPLVRLPRARRAARRLRGADHGSRTRKLAFRRTWFGPAQAVERAELPVRRPSAPCSTALRRAD